MAQRELFTWLDAGKVQAIAPIATLATVLSAAIDLAGYNSVLVAFDLGIEGITLSAANRIDALITECDTSGGTYTAVAVADLVTLPGGVTTLVVPFSAQANTDIPATWLVAYLGTKRFIKVGLTYVGTHGTATPVSVSVFRGHKRALNP